MVQKKAVNKKVAVNNKKGPKAKQVVEEEPEMEVEASEDESDVEGEEVEADSGSEAEEGADLVDSQAEEDEEDDDDDDDDDEEEDDDEDEDEDDDGLEPGEVSNAKTEDDDDNAGSDSDDEPTEAPIGKPAKNAQPTVGGIPKVAVGRIPEGTPKEQLVFISQLPKDYKHVDLVALLVKFGPLIVVDRLKSKAGGNNAIVAFETAEGAEAALAAKGKALVFNGKPVNISRPFDKDTQNERTIMVGLIGPQTTKEELTEHFQTCGPIESVRFSNNRAMPTGYICFESADSIKKALKMHSTEFNSRFITVREVAKYKPHEIKAPGITLIIANTGEHESYSSHALEKIFKKHGDLVDIDVVCSKSLLGFATYKTKEDADKAFKQLNGKTIDNLEIKLDSYSHNSSGRTVLVTNLANGVEENDLRDVFSKCGEIDNIKMLPHKAVIKFTTDDGYCKSFLLNERVLKEQPIFLEPNSFLKHKILQRKPQFNKNKNFNPNNKKAFKRPAFNGFGGAPRYSKKAKRVE